MTSKRLRLIALLLTPMWVSGCASIVQDLLEDHQCARAAANRPDALQREAECQHPRFDPSTTQTADLQGRNQG